MQIAVAGVPDGDDAQAGPGGQGLDPADHFGNLSDRHGHVLGEEVLGHRHQDLAEGPPRFPEPLAFVRGLGDPVVGPTQHFDHLHQVELHELLVVAVLLDDQDGLQLGLETRWQLVRHQLQRTAVQDLDGGRKVAGGQRPRHRLTCLFQSPGST